MNVGPFLSICIRSNFLLFVLCIASAIFSSFVSLFAGKAIGMVALLIYDSGQQSFAPLFIVFLASLAVGLGVFARVTTTGLFGSFAIKSIQKNLYSGAVNAKVKDINAFFDILSSAFSLDITTIRNFLSADLSVALRNTFTLLGSITMLLYTDWNLFLYVVLITFVILLFIVFFGRLIKHTSKNFKKDDSGILRSVLGDFANIKLIKSFVCEDKFVADFSKKVDLHCNALAKYFILRAVFIATVIVLTACAIFSVLLIGVKSVSAGSMSVAAFAEFVFYALLSASSANTIAEMYNSFKNFSLSATKVSKAYNVFLNKKNFNLDNFDKNFFDKIEFKNAFFSYSADAKVLNDVNFFIKKSDTVAIVGPSGSGKSTILNLLLGFYKVDSGFVFIDGSNIDSFCKKSIRNLFAWVPQDINIIDGTIEENITMKQQSDPDRLKKACQEAGIWDFIENLPKKEKCLLVNHDLQLSRGQQQRIAIARAIFSDRPIIVFDESTSSLDAKSDSVIRDYVKALHKTKTIIIIAHNLSAVKWADKVIVLENGRVTDFGSHSDLALRDGYYRDAIKLQSLDA